jgi:proteasome lid subunit RPN8/RPN11
VAAAQQVLTVPTDLAWVAFRRLFPAERMAVLAGRVAEGGLDVTSAADVTGADASQVHVRASAALLTAALMDVEATGARLAAWAHSHPGRGPGCAAPSEIDLRQHAELSADVCPDLVGMIFVEDGWLRLFGDAVESGRVRVQWRGDGVRGHPGLRGVFRLAR